MKISMDGKKRNKKQLKIKLSVLIWFLIAIFLSGCGPAYFRAIKKHDIEFMKKYIAEGNELNNMDSVFITPLMAAAQFNDINIAQLLIEKGASASVNYVDIHGVTALHVAKSSEMVQLLLKAGADVNVSSKWGETPLHWAKTGEIVKLLLEAGAELNGLTKLGETPLDVAYYANSKDNTRTDVIAVLQEKGGVRKYSKSGKTSGAKNDHERAQLAMKEGRPYDAIAYYSEQVKKVGYEKLDPADLMQICHAYDVVRDFRNSEACNAEWDRRANTGDGSYTWSPVKGYVQTDTYVLYSILGKADQLIRMGDFQGVISYLESYLNKDGQFDFSNYEVVGKMFGKVVLKKPYSSYAGYPPLIYSYLRIGNQEKARHYLALLENYMEGRMKDEARMELAYTFPSTGKGACSQEEKFDYVYLNNLILEEGVSEHGLMEIYLELGEYAKALTLANLLLAAQNRQWCVLKGQKLNFEYMALTMQTKRAHLLMKLGKTADSKNLFQEQLTGSMLKGFSDYHRLALFDLGLIALQEKDQALAIDYFKQAIEVIESQRKTINTEATRIGFAGDKQAVYKQLVATLVETGRDGEAFSYAERGKARALIDMLAYKEDIRMKNDESGRAKNLLTEMSRAEMKILMASSSDSDPQTSSEADKTRGITLTARKDITQADPEFASLITVTPPDVATLQGLLPQGETLVEYYGFDDDLFVFVVDKDGVKGLKLDATGLDQAVKAFRTSLLAPPEAARGIKANSQVVNPRQELRASGTALYQRLVAPIEPMIKNGNVTIVPHGALHYLPFNALHTGQAYVLNKFHLRVLPSAGVMQFLQAKHEQPSGNLLAIGNPDLGDPSLDLPGAEEEARAIANKIPETRLFTRGEATETTVKDLSSQYRYLHLATHGTFDAAHPLSSGLYMAKDGTNDGILSVGELYELSIPADLVTLSACETGLGKVANGDDVVGFTRGFLYAGTSSIVSSLWQVDDQATSLLMQNFYDNLQKEDKREALREAQLHVMSTYNADPYYWAAFQLTGAVQ